MNKIVLITGLPRSGTSMAAAIVHGLGVPVVPASQPKSTSLPERYPVGNMEDIAFRDLVWRMTDQDRCFEQYDKARRHFARAERDRFTVQEQEMLEAWLRARYEDADSDFIGVKLPALMFILQPLVNFLKELDVVPQLLFSHRDFADCVNSLARKRGDIYAPEAPHAWASAVQAYNHWHLIRAEQFAAQSELPWEDVDFRSVIDVPENVAYRIAAFLGREFKEEALASIDLSLHGG